MWFYLCAVVILSILSFLPKVSNQHWFFRVFEFIKIQLSFLIFFTFCLGFFLPKNMLFYLNQTVLLFVLIYHWKTLIKYTKLFPVNKPKIDDNLSSEKISFISANVYQFNKQHEKFIQLITEQNPDFFLTMESNSNWEKKLKSLEKDYPYFQKATLENTYGMHLFSKIEIENAITHFFVADDIPSIEAHFKTKDNFKFVFFGIHPPPPSPTEEETSKERDGELLSVAKRIKNINKPIVAAGDFNNVAWSKSSILFKKASNLLDPRIGYGFISTFHAKYKLLRFPIDLLFHSTEIFIRKLTSLENFGSDHLPLYCEFQINLNNEIQENKTITASKEDKKAASKLIEKGIEANGNRADS